MIYLLTVLVEELGTELASSDLSCNISLLLRKDCNATRITVVKGYID